MYYNNQQNYDSYYSTYKQELQELNKKNQQQNIQQLLILGKKILIVTLFLTLSFYLYNHYIEDNPSKLPEKTTTLLAENRQKIEELPAIELPKEVLPKSIQLRESKLQSPQYIKEHSTDYEAYLNTIKNPEHLNISKKVIETSQESDITMNSQDLALIVQIIMSQIQTKKSSHGSQEALLNKNDLAQKLTKAEEDPSSIKNLKEGNYYNKVVIKKRETPSSYDKLAELRDKINAIVNEKILHDEAEEYTKSLRKEISVRSNEMRIIVVKKGDSLSKLAKKAYGKYNAYPKILKANPEIIKNPNQIYAGMRLRIPSY